MSPRDLGLGLGLGYIMRGFELHIYMYTCIYIAQVLLDQYDIVFEI